MSLQTHAFARRNCDGLAQIGPTRFDVTGIRFLEGETGASGGTITDPPAGGTVTDPPAASTPPWGDDPSKFDPDKMWKLAENLRGDIAAEKAKRDQAIADAVARATADAQKNTLAEFAKLLTGEKEPETDPVKLAATIAEKDQALTAAQATAADAQRTAQAVIHGVALGANIPALLADPAFKTSIGSVDPTDEAAVKAVITQALQANAALKQPPRSSGDVAPTGPTVQTLESLLAAAEKAGNAAESIVLKRRIAALQAKS